MAHEKATLSFTLDDQFSSQMQEIVGKLGDFKRQLDETARKGGDEYREFGKDVQQLNQRMSGVEARLQSMGNLMRSAFAEFNKSLGQTHDSVAGIEGALAKLAVASFGLHTPMRGFGGALTLLGVQAGVASSGLLSLGSAFSQSFLKAEELRRQLGASNDYFIEYQVRIGQHLGETRQQTLQRLQRFASQFYETVRGSQSQLFGILSRFGDEGMQVFQQLQRARESGMESAQAYQEILMPWLSSQPEARQRRLSELLKIPFYVISQYQHEYENTKPPWVPDEESWNKWKDANTVLRRALKNIHDTLEDEAAKNIFPWKFLFVETLAGIAEYIAANVTTETLNQKLDEFKQSELMTDLMNEWDKFRKDIEKIPDDVRAWAQSIQEFLEPIFEFLEKWGLMSRNLPEPKQDDYFLKGTILDPGQSWSEIWQDLQNRMEWARRMREDPTQQLPLRAEERAGGARDVTSPMSQAAQQEQVAVDNLREIRDVMVWLRTQMKTKGKPVGGPTDTGGGELVNPRTGQTYGGGAPASTAGPPPTTGPDQQQGPTAVPPPPPPPSGAAQPPPPPPPGGGAATLPSEQDAAFARGDPMRNLMTMPPSDWNKLVAERPSIWWTGGVPIRDAGYDAFVDRHEESSNVQRRQSLRPWGFKPSAQIWEHGGSMGWQARAQANKELEAAQSATYGGQLGELQRGSLSVLGARISDADPTDSRARSEAASGGQDFNWADWGDVQPRVKVGIRVRGPRGMRVTSQDHSGIVDDPTVSVDHPTASADELEE